MPQTVPPALTARSAHNGLDHNVRSKPCIVQITAEFHEHGIELLMKQCLLTKVVERKGLGHIEQILLCAMRIRRKRSDLFEALLLR